MNIRWRLAILIIQIIVLVVFSLLVTGKLITGDTWFIAGLLAVVINPTLLEPYYPRPGDVIGNTAITFLLGITTVKTITKPAWSCFLLVLSIAFVLSLIAIVLGSRNNNKTLSSIAKAANIISREATALRIYSLVFWLSIVEAFPNLNRSFWLLALAWLVIYLFGSVNWQRVWFILTGNLGDCTSEGMIGPSTLLVSSANIPEPGTTVTLCSGATLSSGVVITRIRRTEDVWGQIHLPSQKDCGAFVRAKNISIQSASNPQIVALGSVDAGTDDTNLLFLPTQPLEVGNVVSVNCGDKDILYQIRSAKIHKTDVKGGSHLQVLSQASQLGIFNSDSFRLEPHRWVPTPGSTIYLYKSKPTLDTTKLTPLWLQLGTLLGTELPIFIDLTSASEGHLAILGMTKMGKTTLAVRLGTELSKNRVVTILDQTGEYKSKRKIAIYDRSHDKSTTGIKVLEPITEIPPRCALNYLNQVIAIAKDEYQKGTPLQRAILVDEAHQFIPEPASLGFNAPGRDDSFNFSSLMMQIRKYGITIILISQRTAVVAKSALSQCENIIAFKSVDQTGLDYLEAVAGHQARDLLPKLRQGEALVFGPAISSDVPVVIKVSQ